MIFSSPLPQSPPLITPNLSSKSSSQPSLLKPRRALIIVASATCASAERERTSSYLPPKLATSFYELLGVQMGATSEEIKAAYRRRARVCHPDVVAIDRKDTSSDEFMRIHAAYSTLSDPNKRADYDRRLFRRHRSIVSYSDIRGPEVSRFNGYTSRNWETDQCW